MPDEISNDIDLWTPKQRLELVLQLVQSGFSANNALQKYEIPLQKVEEWISSAFAAQENQLSIGLVFGESFHIANNKLGMAKWLAKKIRDGNYDDKLDHIKNSADSIIKSINFYLSVLKQSQSMTLNQPSNTMIDLRELIIHATKRKKFSPKISIVINFNVVNSEIYAPSKQVEQVFLVLLQNAIDAINDEIGEIIISIDDSDDQRAMIVQISNTGKAIPKEMQENLFAFSPTDRDRWLGLGLAWANSFLRSYGGGIIYETTDDQRPTFSIRLPKVFGLKI